MNLWSGKDERKNSQRNYQRFPISQGKKMKEVLLYCQECCAWQYYCDCLTFPHECEHGDKYNE